MNTEKNFDSGAGRISVERIRQIVEEGYTAEHDTEHSTRTLIQAAEAYIHFAEPMSTGKYPDSAEYFRRTFSGIWPWDEESFKPVDVETALVKAGALIAAALDRIDVEKKEGSN